MTKATKEPLKDSRPAVEGFFNAMAAVFTKFGVNLKITERIPEWLVTAGFNSIHDRVLPMKSGALNLAQRSRNEVSF
jgi:hypothetical protein